MAAPPSTATPASWNPAVPPPPVTGAPLGTSLLPEALGVGLDEGVALALADADELDEALELGWVLELAEVLAEASALAEPLAKALAEPLAVAAPLTEPLTLGDSTVTDELGLPDEVQAESATQVSMAVRPHRKAVSRIRCAVHAMAVRAPIEPPHVLGNDHFPIAGGRNEENAGDLKR